VQVRDGMQVTGMTDHVSWGLYIANFTFLVGLAAGGVMMVIPAYLYHDEDMHDVTIIGELLAIAAIVMCLMFVTSATSAGRTASGTCSPGSGDSTGRSPCSPGT
jgi:Ni/Fe-hydrogenase subunit HybB-like protein